MKTGRSLVELAKEIERQNESKKDYIADSRSLEVVAGDEKITVTISSEDVRHEFGMNDIAHQQIATAFGVPYRYYERMRNDQPGLLAQNINCWMQSEPKTRMIRTLDGNARAFLSDRYRRIDNGQIAEAIFPILADIPGIEIASCEVTDSKLYIKAVNPRLQTEVVPGDVVQSGICVTNSEVGLGSVQVVPLIYRLVCTNGMVVNDAGQRRKHVGRANEATEDFTLFENETIEADNRAFMLKLRDTVKAVSDAVHFNRVVDLMRESRGAAILGDIPKVVELTANEFSIGKAEGQGILDHLIRGGELNLFGMANAITRFSQDVSSYDRASELESLGYDVLNMGPKTWSRINEQARILATA